MRGLSGPTDIVFGPDGFIYVTGYYNSGVKRYHPATGAFVNDFVPSGSGSLMNPWSLLFVPIVPCTPPNNDTCAQATPVLIGSPAFCGSTACATPSTSVSIQSPCGGISDGAPDCGSPSRRCAMVL